MSQQKTRSPVLYYLRLWLVFFTFVNLAIVCSLYAWDHAEVDRLNRGRPYDEQIPNIYHWSDIAAIFSSVGLFFSYAYSAFGNKSLVHRYLRAFLMFIPGLFLFAYHLRVLHTMVLATTVYEIYLFSCSNWPEELITTCSMQLTLLFTLIFTGFFTVIEIFVTLFKGPLYPSKDVY